MARRSQQRSGFARSASRPNRGWVGIVSTAPVVVAANSKVLLGTFVLTNQGIDVTVLCTVGGVGVSPDTSAATENQLGAIGMCVVTDAATAIGITALPDPVTDVEDDVWFFYQGFANRMVVSDVTGINFNASTWYSFDSKAKRIVSTGQNIAIVAGNAHATQGFQLALNFWMLAQVRGTR